MENQKRGNGIETDNWFQKRELDKTNILGFEVTIHSKGYVADLKTKLHFDTPKLPPMSNL